MDLGTVLHQHPLKVGTGRLKVENGKELALSLPEYSWDFRQTVTLSGQVAPSTCLNHMDPSGPL
jgi:hypothetical protein